MLIVESVLLNASECLWLKKKKEKKGEWNRFGVDSCFTDDSANSIDLVAFSGQKAGYVDWKKSRMPE